MEQEYKLAAFYPEDLVFHKEQLLEPVGQATEGSSHVWFDPPPSEAAQPIPQSRHVFDGSQASAAAVGLGNLPTDEPVLFKDEEQDEDRRQFQHHEDREGV